jgi:hypothetical protein
VPGRPQNEHGSAARAEAPDLAAPDQGLRLVDSRGMYAELIGSIRRECADHLIVFNAEHLRRILAKYATYYNEMRTHVSLGKDAPRARPMERFGDVLAWQAHQVPAAAAPCGRSCVAGSSPQFHSGRKPCTDSPL